MTKTYCLGGRHYSNTNNITQYEKVNSKTKKLVKIIKKVLVVFANEINHKFLLSK